MYFEFSELVLSFGTRQTICNYFVICHFLIKPVSECHTMKLCLTTKIKDGEDSYVLCYLTAGYKFIT
jgi:hypothetical protein